MITVFTPCYNRAYTLQRLFDSLQAQSCPDFEWVVVDDGSTDETAELCAEFLKEANFPMRYFWQENAGKHVAINLGAAEARGEWFFIVDSDDYLPADSIEVNEGYLAQVAGDPGFAGASGVRARADGSLLLGPGLSLDDFDQRTKDLLAREYVDATPQDYHSKLKAPGDRAEIVRTELVRRYPFPSFEGERFISEYLLWQSISEEGLKLRWFNKPTYCADYLEDGLTKNMRGIMLKNPLGRSYVDNFTIGSHAPLRIRLKSAINYTRYGRFGGKGLGELMKEAKNKPFAVLGLPIALVLPIKGEM